MDYITGGEVAFLEDSRTIKLTFFVGSGVSSFYLTEEQVSSLLELLSSSLRIRPMVQVVDNGQLVSSNKK